MPPIEPKPLTEVFKEGLDARNAGGRLVDNPYAAGSEKRREWAAGFCASLESDDRDDSDLDPDDRPGHQADDR